MKRVILLLAILSTSIALQAQPKRGLKEGSVDVSKYPEISFTWNEWDSAVKNQQAFVLAENDSAVNISKFERITPSSVPQNKNILFLWEDNGDAAKYNFTKSVLLKFFESAKAGDNFRLATFSRVTGKEPLINVLSPFTSKDTLRNAVEGYRRITARYGATDLFSAVDEALKLFGNGGINVVVVITAGYNQSVPGAETTYSKKAYDAGVPVYVVQYPALATYTPASKVLIESSFGDGVNIGDAGKAATELTAKYSAMATRYYGQDYRITFTTTAPRDGKPHNFTLKVGAETKTLQFVAPDMTLAIWCKENIVLAIIFGVLIIGIIVLIVILIRNFVRKIKAKQQENENKNRILEDELKEHKDKTKRQQDKLQREKEAAEQAERERQERERLEKLSKLMAVQNKFPRLFYELNNEKKIFTINKPVTEIGRLETSDLVLPKGNVSRPHARIEFDGTAFTISNLSASNRTVVNGEFIESKVLKNGDMIGIGEIILTIYM